MINKTHIYEPLRMIKSRVWGEVIKDILAGKRERIESLKELAKKLEPHKPLETDEEKIFAGLKVVLMETLSREPYFYCDETVVKLAWKESMFASETASFVKNGKNIIHFDESLTRALARTENANMMASDLKLPWDCFYIHFDDPSMSEGPMTVDGFYIRHDRSKNQVIITPLVRDHGLHEYFGIWSYIITFASGLSLLEEIEDNSGKNWPDKPKNSDEPMREIMERTTTILASALIYLSADEDPGETRWQDGAPAKLVEKARSGGKIGEKAEKQLSYSMWTKVNYVGLPNTQGFTGDSGSKSAHWVKGHFRHQAHGPKMQDRKIIWIRPHVSGGTIEEAASIAKVRIVTDKEKPIPPKDQN